MEKEVKKISEKREKRMLVNIVKSYLRTAIDLMSYYYSISPDKKSKKVSKKSIKACERALFNIEKIKHLDILKYLYSNFIGNNVIAYSISGQIVVGQKIKEWDTEEGHEDFVQMIKQLEEKDKLKEEQRKKQLEAIQKAKEQGKKVEMVYDDATKQVKPLIIEEKQN